MDKKLLEAFREYLNDVMWQRNENELLAQIDSALKREDTTRNLLRRIRGFLLVCSLVLDRSGFYDGSEHARKLSDEIEEVLNRE